MDGFYATSKDRGTTEAFLSSVFNQLAGLFLAEKSPHFRFVIKGGLAFGEVYHGRDIAGGAKQLDANECYRNSIILGTPVVDAHLIEKAAAPFGVAVHESAREQTKNDKLPFGEWWHWFDATLDRKTMRAAIEEHYRWCRGNRATYDPARIVAHEALALKYFEGQG